MNLTTKRPGIRSSQTAHMERITQIHRLLREDIID
jgi:hypothetical protein